MSTSRSCLSWVPGFAVSAPNPSVERSRTRARAGPHYSLAGLASALKNGHIIHYKFTITKIVFIVFPLVKTFVSGERSNSESVLHQTRWSGLPMATDIFDIELHERMPGCTMEHAIGFSKKRSDRETPFPGLFRSPAGRRKRWSSCGPCTKS